MLSPFTAPLRAAADAGWSGVDWMLYVVLPVILVLAGAALYVAGRREHAEAVRIKAGFGGPPGSLDIGSDLGFGVENNRGRVLAAQRKMLWGGILAGIGLIWLVVSLVMRLV